MNMVRAEAFKLTRPRVLAGAAVAIVIAVAIATSVTFLAARASDPFGRAPTLGSLAEAGGGTDAFSLGVSFLGFFSFVVFIANWTGEFTQGTFRTLLMRQPNRVAVLGGKLLALVGLVAAMLLAGLATTWVASIPFAAAKDISTSSWFSIDAVGEAARDYGLALFGITAWALFGMALAVIVRSTPLALGIGIAWAGPFEHLTQRATDVVSGWYPGLLLEAVAVGGTDDAPLSRALPLLLVYMSIAAAAGVWSFTRRDITG